MSDNTPESVDDLPLGSDGGRRTLVLIAVPVVAVVAVIALVLALSGDDDEENVAADATTTSTSVSSTTTSSTTYTSSTFSTTVVEVTTTAAPATTKPPATTAPPVADVVTFSTPSVEATDIGGGECRYRITSSYVTSPPGGEFIPNEFEQWILDGPGRTYIYMVLVIPYDAPIAPEVAQSVAGTVKIPGQTDVSGTFPVPLTPNNLC
jgi:hypothetical protein